MSRGIRIDLDLATVRVRQLTARKIRNAERNRIERFRLAFIDTRINPHLARSIDDRLKFGSIGVDRIASQQSTLLQRFQSQ